jgi:lysophospholipase L1-like esterase
MDRFGGLRGICFCLFLSLIAACGGERYDDIRNIRSAGQSIICFGDSLTEGVGATPGDDYPSALSRLIGFSVINAGRRGDTTAQALARLPESVLGKNPRLVIVLLGGNDFLRQAPRQETRKNLEEIVSRIQAEDAMVVIDGAEIWRALHSPGDEGNSYGFGLEERWHSSKRRRLSFGCRAHR